MKKTLAVFLCVIFAISVICHPVATLAVNGEHDCDSNTDIVSPDRIDETAPPEEEIPCVPISEIDLDEDLAFLVDYDVVVPNIYLEVEDLNGLIRETIDYVRKNNYKPSISNFESITFFRSQITFATAEHDGVVIGSTSGDSYEPTRYTLTDSTKYKTWKQYFNLTNCYGYALGRKIWKNIGYFGNAITESQVAYFLTNGKHKLLAIALKADLEQMGYTV